MDTADVELEDAPQETGEPTRDDVMAAALWISENTNEVPCFWGPTASGKTVLARLLAQVWGAKLWVVLLSQSSPDDVAGFLTIPAQGEDGLVAQLPQWAGNVHKHVSSGGKAVILLDEIGTAREEVRAAMYTFMRDRSLQGQDFNSPNIRVLAATNAAVFEAPYLSRIAFLNVPADKDYLRSFVKSELARLAIRHGKIEDKYEKPPAPQFMHGANVAAIDAINKDFYNLTPAAQRLVLESLVPPNVVENLIRRMSVGIIAKAEELVKHPALLSKTLSNMSPVECVRFARTEVLPLIGEPNFVWPTGKDNSKEQVLVAVLDVVFNSSPDHLFEYYFFEDEDKVRQERTAQAIMTLNVSEMHRLFVKEGRLSVNPKTGGLFGSFFDRAKAMSEELKQVSQVLSAPKP